MSTETKRQNLHAAARIFASHELLNGSTPGGEGSSATEHLEGAARTFVNGDTLRDERGARAQCLGELLTALGATSHGTWNDALDRVRKLKLADMARTSVRNIEHHAQNEARNDCRVEVLEALGVDRALWPGISWATTVTCVRDEQRVKASIQADAQKALDARREADAMRAETERALAIVTNERDALRAEVDRLMLTVTEQRTRHDLDTKSINEVVVDRDKAELHLREFMASIEAALFGSASGCRAPEVIIRQAQHAGTGGTAARRLQAIVSACERFGWSAPQHARDLGVNIEQWIEEVCKERDNAIAAAHNAETRWRDRCEAITTLRSGMRALLVVDTPVGPIGGDQ